MVYLRWWRKRRECSAKKFRHTRSDKRVNLRITRVSKNFRDTPTEQIVEQHLLVGEVKEKGARLGRSGAGQPLNELVRLLVLRRTESLLGDLGHDGLKFMRWEILRRYMSGSSHGR